MLRERVSQLSKWVTWLTTKKQRARIKVLVQGERMLNLRISFGKWHDECGIDLSL